MCVDLSNFNERFKLDSHELAMLNCNGPNEQWQCLMDNADAFGMDGKEVNDIVMRSAVIEDKFQPISHKTRAIRRLGELIKVADKAWLFDITTRLYGAIADYYLDCRRPIKLSELNRKFVKAFRVNTGNASLVEYLTDLYILELFPFTPVRTSRNGFVFVPNFVDMALKFRAHLDPETPEYSEVVNWEKPGPQVPAKLLPKFMDPNFNPGDYG